MSADAAAERTPAYRRKLLLLLSSATFFEGYDNFVLSFVLALVLVDLGGTEAEAGWIRALVGLGAVVAFLLSAQADRIGRRRLLLITIVGYTVSAALTAVSPNLAWLAAAQFTAQVFLGAEWAVAVTIVVEDFPPHERGRAIGIVTSMNTLGGILVGLLAFVGLQSTPLGWRAFFVVGLIPLVLIAIGRRSMRETERYEAVRADPSSERLDHTSLWEPWKREYRSDVLAVGLLTFFRHAAVAAAAFWWAYYAQQEVGMSVSLSGLYLAAAGVLGAVGSSWRGGSWTGSGGVRRSSRTCSARSRSGPGCSRSSRPPSCCRCSVPRSSSASARSSSPRRSRPSCSRRMCAAAPPPGAATRSRSGAGSWGRSSLACSATT